MANVPVREATSICICGAGIAGLTLAGILSKQLGKQVRIEVLERAPATYDQGYGLDLDKHGQEALALAGVYDRYWEISRPLSDSWVIHSVGRDEPLVVAHRPAFLQAIWPSTFAARPESNRGKLRDILLDALAVHGNALVKFEVQVENIRESPNGKAQIMSKSDEVLGEYDLVVDATGLHSSLRHHRVLDEVGKHWNGQVMIHGMISDPETSCSVDFMEKFGTKGTMMVVGRGYGMVFQRFGGGLCDNRTSFFYHHDHKLGENGILGEMGIPKPNSRKTGMMSDENLAKAKTWICKDMGDRFEKVWHDAIEKLECVTVRNVHAHGETSLRDGMTVPLICIGDSLLSCSLGGGGILAMQDAIDVSKCFMQPDFFDSSCGKVNISALRGIEPSMLKRKVDFVKEKNAKKYMWAKRNRDVNGDGAVKFQDIFPQWRKRLMMQCMASIFKHLYTLDELAFGHAGSTPESPVYPNVAKAMGLQQDTRVWSRGFVVLSGIIVMLRVGVVGIRLLRNR